MKPGAVVSETFPFRKFQTYRPSFRSRPKFSLQNWPSLNTGMRLRISFPSWEKLFWVDFSSPKSKGFLARFWFFKRFRQWRGSLQFHFSHSSLKNPSLSSWADSNAWGVGVDQGQSYNSHFSLFFSTFFFSFLGNQTEHHFAFYFALIIFSHPLVLCLKWVWFVFHFTSRIWIWIWIWRWN